MLEQGVERPFPQEIVLFDVAEPFREGVKIGFNDVPGVGEIGDAVQDRVGIGHGKRVEIGLILGEGPRVVGNDNVLGDAELVFNHDLIPVVKEDFIIEVQASNDDVGGGGPPEQFGKPE